MTTQIDPLLATLRGPNYTGVPRWQAIRGLLTESKISPRNWSFRQFAFVFDYLGRVSCDPTALPDFRPIVGRFSDYRWLPKHRELMGALHMVQRAVNNLQMIVYETRRIHHDAGTSPTPVVSDDIPAGVLLPYMQEISATLEGNVEVAHKFGILQSLTEALTDLSSFSQVDLLLDEADTIETRHSLQAVTAFSGCLVRTWTTCPPLHLKGQGKIDRLVRLAESIDKRDASNMPTLDEDQEFRLFEPSCVVYVQAAKALWLYLALGSDSSPSAKLVARYDRERRRLCELFATRAHIPSVTDLRYAGDFRPDHVVGWPSSLPDIQTLLASSRINGLVASAPPEQLLGSIVELPLPLGLHPEPQQPRLFIRIPGDDMAPFLLGVAGIEYLRAYRNHALTTWANDHHFFVSSGYGLLARELPQGRDATPRAIAPADAYGTLVSTLVGMATGSLVGPAVSPLGRLMSVYFGRELGLRSWRYFVEADEKNARGAA